MCRILPQIFSYFSVILRKYGVGSRSRVALHTSENSAKRAAKGKTIGGDYSTYTPVQDDRCWALFLAGQTAYYGGVAFATRSWAVLWKRLIN
jgi:hypothetical protein